MNYNLQIISNSLYERNKNNARSKYNSIYFIDYSPIVAEIFNQFDYDYEFNRFRLRLFKRYESKIKIHKLNTGFKFVSDPINVSSHDLACVLPQYIRRKYFIYDNFYDKYVWTPEILNSLDYI